MDDKNKTVFDTEAIEEESIDSKLKKFSPEELELLKDIVGSVVDDTYSFKEPQLIREIAPVKEWIASPYYMGAYANSIYPFWQEEIKNFEDHHVEEMIISGSIGSGKSTAALIMVMRKIYVLSCYDHPQRLFHLADMTRISIAYLSISIRQAEMTGFGQLRDMIDDSPYFREKFGRDTGISSMLRFPRNVYVIPGSDASTIIGTNLLGVIMDEANFHKKQGAGFVSDINKALRIYAETTDRRKSRFAIAGKDPGFSIIVSSATTQSSFTHQRIQKSDPGTCRVIMAKLWDTKPKNYSAEYFWVFIGSDTEDPYIVDSAQDVVSAFEKGEIQTSLLSIMGAAEAGKLNLIDSLIFSLPEKERCKFLKVPMDFRKNFDTDIFTALSNIGGVSVAPSGRLFTANSIWSKAILEELKHPFSRESIFLGARDTRQLSDYFRKELLFDKEKKCLLRHPGEKRYVHIDQSSTGDATGITCVHKAGLMESRIQGVTVPMFEADFFLKILPPPAPDRMSLSKIGQFIFYLRELGMEFGAVTYDQYQSEDRIQIFNANGINSYRQSVEGDLAYIMQVELLNEGRWVMYNYPPLKKEFFNLEHDRDHRRVDHPKKNVDGTPGSKDIADSWVGAVKACTEAKTGGVYGEKKEALIRTQLMRDESVEYLDSWVVGNKQKIRYV